MHAFLQIYLLLLWTKAAFCLYTGAAKKRLRVKRLHIPIICV